VRLPIIGAPILTAVCYCDDCQAGARQLEALGASPDFHDAWGGTPYVTMRDDRLGEVEGADRLKAVKLQEGSPTTRYIATCCNSPMYLKYRPGWWTSVYRNRLGQDAPRIEVRGQVRHAVGPAPLPDDVPAYRSFPAPLFPRLIAARLMMWAARGLGWRVYGVGVIHLAVVALIVGTFLPGQAAPKDFPARTALAYAAGAFMLVAGLALEWRRTAASAAAALAAYFGVVVALGMDARLIVSHPGLYLVYENIAEQLATAAGALIAYALLADFDETRRARLIRAGQVAFGLCAIVFGGAHFAYMQMTAPLVPKWLPPSQVFWAYATGVFQIAAGLAMILRLEARLAAILLTVMYALFALLVHLPRIVANPADTGAWIENATNLALIGVAWIAADSFARSKL
jgi:uncharacterized membrane protein